MASDSFHTIVHNRRTKLQQKSDIRKRLCHFFYFFYNNCELIHFYTHLAKADSSFCVIWALVSGVLSP